MNALDGRTTDGGHVEAHVLLRFGDLDDDKAARGAKLAGAEDGPIRAFNGLDSKHGPFFHGHALTDVEPAHFLGKLPAEVDVLFFAGCGGPASQHPWIHEQLRT